MGNELKAKRVNLAKTEQDCVVLYLDKEKEWEATKLLFNKKEGE